MPRIYAKQPDYDDKKNNAYLLSQIFTVLNQGDPVSILNQILPSPNYSTFSRQ